MIDYSSNLLKSVHKVVPLPEDGDVFYCKGDYDYWHYGCDGFNDQGWGCGYRTLQTIASWICTNLHLKTSIPSLRDVQEVLVNLEDKELNFIGSKEWIGCFEVCLVLDTLYKIQSKVVHIPNQKSFFDNKHTFIDHFTNYGSLVMMGGDKDCSSKGIAGILLGINETYLLIIDPHFVGEAKSVEQLIDNGYIYWKKISDFSKDSFYNVCFPQAKYIAR